MGHSIFKIKTEFDITKTQNQMLTLENKMVKLADRADRVRNKLTELGNAKIKTTEYAELEKELKLVNKETEKLGNKVASLSEKGTYNAKFKDAKSEYTERLNYADQLEQKMHQMAMNGTAFIEPTTTEAYKKAEQDLEACNREMTILNQKHEELKSKQVDVDKGTNRIARRFKKLVASVFVFSQFTKAFYAMISAMKDGLQDMALYSEEYNNKMSACSSATAELKYNLASMAEPILSILLPTFATLVGWINTAVEAVTKFLSVMGGKNTYTKAKKQVIDYAKGVRDAEKANKGALASFDDVDVLDNSSQNSTSNGGLSGANAFEEVEIESTFLETVGRIRDLFMEILPYAIGIGVAIGLWKLGSFLTGLLVVGSTFGLIMGTLVLISGLALAIYSYFQMWENGVDGWGIVYYIAGIALAVVGLLVLFGPVAAGIGIIVGAVAGLILAIKDIMENGLNASNLTLLIISIIGILLGVMVAFGAKAMLIVAIIGLVIGIIAAAIKWTENGEEALGHLKDAFKALGDFVSKIFAGDMEGAFESLEQAGKSFGNFFISIAEGIANGFIKMVNVIIDAINSIEFGPVPDWVPLIGGKSFNLGIPNWNAHVEIPRLATGAVFPGGNPYMAIVNDQPAGQTNIETPLSTMVDAFKMAMADMGGVSGGKVEIVIDGKVLGVATLPYLQNEINRVGTTLVK